MTDSGPEIQKVIAVADQEAAAMQSGDMKEYLTILSDDAVFMPPNTLAKQGEELRQWLREFVNSNRVEWPRFEHGETIVAGDLAFHEYVYTMKATPKAGGSARRGIREGLASSAARSGRGVEDPSQYLERASGRHQHGRLTATKDGPWQSRLGLQRIRHAPYVLSAMPESGWRM